MNINGYSIKAVNSLEGRNGVGFSANLYYKNKQIGSITDTADGSGEIGVYMNSVTNHEIHDQIVDSDFAERLFYLHCDEKSFKNMVKKGHGEALISVTMSEPTKDWQISLEYHSQNKLIQEDDFREWYNKNGKGGVIEKVEIYTRLDDFNIQEPKQAQDLSSQDDEMKMG